MSPPPPAGPPPPHARAAIVSIGDELTRGQCLDTNSRWLADRLMSLGIETIEHATIPDDRAATADTLRRLASAAPLIITTGGLGPTLDDLTRQALADVLDEQLIADAEALEALARRFASRGRTLNEIQKIQACRPPSARMLRNDWGTAPGLHALLAVGAGADIFCLPGPPGEMQPMFEQSVVPALRPDPSTTVRTRLVHLIGLPEGEAAMRLGPLMDRSRNPLVGITVAGLVLTCRVRYAGPLDGAAADREVERTVSAIHGALGPFIFGKDDDTLATVIIRELVARRRTLAVVESCTGGMLGQMLTDVPGSSEAFIGGWITYSNRLKHELVGVPEQDLAAHGAVSEQTARAMAVGGLEKSGADHCLAVTGVAGPGGGSSAKPVGTVFISHAWRCTGPPPSPATASEVRRFLIMGDRDSVRDRSARSALAVLLFALRPPDAPATRLVWEIPLAGAPPTSATAR